MRPGIAISIALLVAPLAAGPASAQSYTPRRDAKGVDAHRVEDHAWAPRAYAVPAPAAPAGGTVSMVPGSGSTPVSVPASNATPGNGNPAAPTTGRWVASLDCVNIPVCGEAGRSRGWGFAVWRQVWTCEGGDCNALPANVPPNNSSCQTSYGDLGTRTQGQCYLGAQNF